MSLMDIFLKEKNDNSKKTNISKITSSKNRIETIMVLYRVFDPPLNRYYSIINSGDLRLVKSDKVKENLSRLHNTSFSYLKTAVDHEKQLKQSFIPFLTTNHPEVILAKNNKNFSLDKVIAKSHVPCQHGSELPQEKSRSARPAAAIVSCMGREIQLFRANCIIPGRM